VVAFGGGLFADSFHLLRDDRHVTEPPRGAGRLVAALQSRLELKCPQKLLSGRTVRLAGERVATRRLERLGGLVCELRRRPTLELSDQRGSLIEVVGADLEQLLAGPLMQPAREAGMEVGAHRLGEAGIRDLADQNVLEAVRRLTRDGRAGLRHEELAQEQRFEHALELVEVGELRDRAAPEDPADHRSSLKDGFLVRR